MSRSIFEEVSEEQRTEGPVPGAATADKMRARKTLSIWLMILAAMVIAQVVIGGLTRLTDSGLSITEWAPISGALPPMSDAVWESEFAKYRATPEYIERNAGMTLAQFKYIYWWEWGHRQWGRLIGLVFVVPFAWFLFKKTIPTGWTGRIALVGALGGLQGAIGWWMVQSGLVDVPDVSQHRLAIHLGLAFVILAMLFWYALSLRREDWDLLQARRRREKGLFGFAGAMAALVFLQIIFGAYVAGLRAWADYPAILFSFPEGESFAPFVERPGTMFLHKISGYLLVVAAAVFWWRARASAHAKTRLWANLFAGAIVAQTLIGVAALHQGVPIAWGSLHQATAVVLFAILIHLKHQIAYPKDEKIAA